LTPGLKRAGYFTFRYIVCGQSDLSRDHLGIKLVTVTKYAKYKMEDGIEKNDSNKSRRGHE